MEQNSPNHEQLWAQTTQSARKDLTIPMDVIAVQSDRMARDWLNGFTEMMFEGVKRNDAGQIDFSKKFTARMIQVDVDSSQGGATSSKSLSVPLLSVAQYPSLTMDNIVFKLSYAVGTTSEDLNTEKNTNSTSLDISTGVDGKFGAVNFSASGKLSSSFSATADSSRKRNTDSRATLDVTATYTRIPPSEGMARLTEALLNSALPVQAG